MHITNEVSQFWYIFVCKYNPYNRLVSNHQQNIPT